MFRIRFHGRGGQGIKTASRILGRAFFQAGYDVQDAPRYGAERRGAPIFAYVRAAHAPINERGIIRHPDLVVIVDDTLLGIPAAGILQGVSPSTVVLVQSDRSAADWCARHPLLGQVVTLPPAGTARRDLPHDSAACAGAAARLTGAIPREELEEAVRAEFAGQEPLIGANLTTVLAGYDRMAPYHGLVAAGSGARDHPPAAPGWIDLTFEAAGTSAPTIHAALTSERVATGLWRTLRPVIDPASCRRCGLCVSYCPEGAISREDDGVPAIDYAHCKGCLICVAECPAHAIHPRPETAAARESP
jgi:pyruvate ferredoxin oxidoreductase gamma subunit